MAFIDDVKALIGENLGDDHDTLIGVIIAGVQASADDYMHLKYFDVVAGATAVFDGGGIFFLPHANVSAVSVSVNGNVISSDSYSVDSPRGVVRMKSGEIPKVFGSVQITYSGGYGEANAPASLRYKIMKQCAYDFRRRKDPGLSAVSFPDGTVSKFEIGEWLSDVREELNRKRRLAG